MRGLADAAAASSLDMDAKPPSTAAPGACRPVRSYVLRQGRMSAAQRSAYDTLYARYCLAYQTTPIDLDQAYGRRAPKILEVGFGMGEVTAAIAAAHPEQDFLGIEVHTPGVGALLKLVDERRLENIRIIQHDAIEVLQHMIAPAALSGVNIFFPDPWPKKRHHKRRLIQPEFARLIAQRLRSGGTVHLATDWEDYAQQMLTVLSADPDFVNVHEAFAPSAGARPRTRFESKGRKAGHQIWDLEFRRR